MSGWHDRVFYVRSRRLGEEHWRWLSQGGGWVRNESEASRYAGSLASYKAQMCFEEHGCVAVELVEVTP